MGQQKFLRRKIKQETGVSDRISWWINGQKERVVSSEKVEVMKLLIGSGTVTHQRFTHRYYNPPSPHTWPRQIVYSFGFELTEWIQIITVPILSLSTEDHEEGHKGNDSILYRSGVFIKLIKVKLSPSLSWQIPLR